MMGWRNAFHCEINPFGRAVLEYWFPDSVSYEDITKTDFSEWRGRIDVLTGGFPCQPFSYAGKRGGRDDDRYLWPEMLRAIGEIRPAWVVGENVAGITTMVEGGVCADLGGSPTLFGEGDDIHEYALRQSFTIERICRDLERVGYSVQPMLVPAAAVGAPHRRDRVFIIANVADPDRCNDAGKSGGYEDAGRAERIQERDEVREPGIADNVRPKICRDATNSASDGRDGCTVNNGEERRIDSNAKRSSEEGPDGIGLRGKFGIYGEQRNTTYAQERFCDGSIPGCSGSFGEYESKLGSCYRKDDVPDTEFTGLERKDKLQCGEGIREHLRRDSSGYGWTANGRILPNNRWAEFPTVSPVHRGNDGIPIRLDNLSLPFAKWRNESLKAYGNAIVPQVMYRIFQAIEQTS